MTRKEAIELLEKVNITSFRPNGTARVKEALDMAIEALSEESKCYSTMDEEYEEAIEALSEEYVTIPEVKLKKPFIIDEPSKGSLTAIKEQIENHLYLEPSGDLISRADAIDAVCNNCTSEKYCDRSCRHICVLPVALSALPSADVVSREDYHNLLMASNDIDRALKEYQAKEEQGVCVVNFIAEQLEHLNDMTDEERLQLLHTLFPSAEAIDAVEVIRCKDCRYWKNFNNVQGICYERPNIITTEQYNDFCSRGERREE